MKGSTRVFVNTLVQYAKTLVSFVVALYTSRIILQNLGVDDFGIYNVVGGVIAMLSFIQSNLARTTQRYLSYYYGKKDDARVISVFNNSVTTQLLISVLICGGLLLCTEVIFDHLLNIPPERVHAAHLVYYFTVANLFVNMQSTPYLATLIARENIVYSSLVQLLDSFLKLPLAISLIYISQDKLIWYAGMMFAICAVNYVCYYVYCKRKYAECQSFSFRSFEPRLFREMFSFMGWNIYGTLCVTGRTQGIALLLNNFYSAAMNAAYGIGNQFFGQVFFLSNALTTAINPRIIKAEGAGDRKAMLRLTEMSCKFSFLLLSIVVIPSVLYMDTILRLWLKDVPEHAALFCNGILLAALLDLLSANLSAANQAVGDVKRYNIWLNSIKILTLPLVFYHLKMQYPLVYVMYDFVAVEGLCALLRIVFIHHTVGLSYRNYLNNVLLPLLPVLMLNGLACYAFHLRFGGLWFLAAFVLSALVTAVGLFLFGLKADERVLVKGVFRSFTDRYRKKR